MWYGTSVFSKACQGWQAEYIYYLCSLTRIAKESIIIQIIEYAVKQKRSQMKKEHKRKDFSVPEGNKQDVTAVINKIQEQLISLERKIDTLISQSSKKPGEEKHFSKPFQGFDRSRHHDRGERDNNFRERSFTNVICSDCGKECQVPFKPSGDRPVYCKDCFAKRKEDRGQRRESYDNKPKEQIFIPERRFDKYKNRDDRKPGKKKKSGFKRRK